VSKSPDCNVAVIGAGPYGLSAAAYLRAAGVETRIFGRPMAFWQNQMPAGMCLRSNWGASHIADPQRQLTLDEYCRQNGTPLSKPIPLEGFVDYVGTSVTLSEISTSAISTASKSMHAGLS
jgi:cation diffusion facilitator CzcD-associated flavoprotein CzcO